jgi:glyoxylase-like metal-dependent hydrolase (beta-lactamase superfamily II)
MNEEVIQIKGKISNIYLLNNDKIAIVDTGSPRDLPLIISCIKENLKRSMHDVDFIIPTHSHIEHMGNAKRIKKITKAKIIFSQKSGRPFEGGVAYLKKFRKGIKAVTASIKNNPEFYIHPLMNIKKLKPI